ncbi:MAG: Tol biopolymer transport system component [Verrucomicrobiales bacterium]
MNRFPFLLSLAAAAGCAYFAFAQEAEPDAGLLSNSRQLTFAGKRAGEGYFSADGSQMIFQSEREPGNPFFQIYLLDLETGDTERISPGKGKTTCGWIHPDGKRVMYASTQDDAESVKKQEAKLAERKAGTVKRYSWDYDENYDIFEASTSGGEYKNLTETRGYDAEGSYSPDGSKIAFASNRHGYTETLSEADQVAFKRNKSHLMDIYIMNADGSGVKRLTTSAGYDGGPFFSPDGKRICWRRFNVEGDQAEIYTMNIDGSDERQITKIGAMSWAPFYHPSGEYLIFATNKHGFANFELYMIDSAGKSEPVRVTDSDGFDGLPAFSPDGKTLSWTSNRTAQKQSQIFVADWDHAQAKALLAENLPATSAAINADDLRKHLEYLASDEMQGRLTGTEGERLATQYAADVFSSYGLDPAGDDGTYFQEFEFTAGINLGDGNELQFDGDTKPEVGKDWQPLSFSSTGKIEKMGVAFAGYGMEAPAEGDFEEYSSYFHLSVKDKWVMVFRYLPEDVTPEQRRRFSQHSSLRYKAMTARQKGAKGLIVVSGPNAQVKSELVPMGFDASLSGSGITAISVSNELAQKILTAGGDTKSLKQRQDELDGGEMAAGKTINTEIGAVIDIKQEKRRGRNVLARMKSGKEGPAVIFGAHIDHLGNKAGATSRAGEGEVNQIHYGADDNASGVSGMFEIAEYLADLNARGKLELKRDAVFAAWSGEEIGLIGSAHFATSEDPDGDVSISDRYAAALNMDMIGRLTKTVVMQGIGSSPWWAGEIEKRNVVVGLPITMQDDAYLATDATSFYLKKVPILNAFTGAHEDYHRPTDTADKIDYDGATKISRLMGLIMRGLLTSDEIPEFTQVERPENQGQRAGLRAYLGTIPDYAQGGVVGVKLSGVTKGAPADKAGIKAGDVIKSVAGKEVKNIYDYTYVLEALKVGAEVGIEIERGGEMQKLKITPGSRD